jgi:hypothetical protein
MATTTLPADILDKIAKLSVSNKDEPAARLRLLYSFNMAPQLKREIQSHKQNVATNLMGLLQLRPQGFTVAYEVVNYQDDEGHRIAFTFRISENMLVVEYPVGKSASAPYSKIMHHKGFKQFMHELRRKNLPIGIWRVFGPRSNSTTKACDKLERAMLNFVIERNVQTLQSQLKKLEDLDYLNSLRHRMDQLELSNSGHGSRNTSDAMDAINAANTMLRTKRYGDFTDVLEKINEHIAIAKDLRRGVPVQTFEDRFVIEPDF